jgi:hypoxanthine phosphoribosyltransferase
MKQALLPAPTTDQPVLEVVLEESRIQARIGELARRISADYRGRNPLLVAILKGAHLFACDLVRRLSIEASLEVIAISRYRRTPEVKEVTITLDLEVDLRGRDVILVEDIVDTGLTLSYLVDELQRRDPASLVACSLLDRPTLRLAEIPLKYVGFDVSEDFLVGYGLDHREQYRNLPYIAVMALE